MNLFISQIWQIKLRFDLSNQQNQREKVELLTKNP
jgi:hypothetical protein